MKPSISIDLPGWCTLRRDPDESSINEALLASSEMATPPGSCSGDKSSNSYSAAGGSDGDSDDDDDDAIARLFSIGGVKRKRGRSNSDSQQQQQQQGSGGGSGAVHHSGPARARRGGGGRSSTSGFGLQAEAFLDWSCVRCTFINAFDEEACQGCGGANLKRDKLLRERRKEVERLGRLKFARECRDRSLKEEAFKDVLEDSESEDDGSSSTAAAPSGTHPTGGCAPAEECLGIPTTQLKLSQPPEPELGREAKAEDESRGNRSSERTSPGRKQDNDCPRLMEQACFIGMLPPDLLLQCSEYLGDTRTLCRVREVSLGWLVVLDDREAGQRLWRPLFYRLRASGSIHAGTDATGQQHRKLKVYDLGPPTPTTLTSSGNTDGAAAGGVASSTAVAIAGSSAASPVQHRLDGGASPGNVHAWSARNPGMGSPAASMGGSATTGSSFRRSSVCAVCGLIQRDGYTGKECEMCASSLVLVTNSRDSPATPRVAYMRVNLTGAATVVGATPTPPSLSAILRGAPTAPSPSQSTPSASVSTPSFFDASSYRGVGSAGSVSTGGTALRGGGGKLSSGLGCEDQGVVGGGVRDVDWHFLVKRLAEEKRIAAGWGSLRHGWVWLQRELQSMLRRRRGDEPLRSPSSSTVASEHATPAVRGAAGPGTLSGDTPPRTGGSCAFGVQASAPRQAGGNACRSAVGDAVLGDAAGDVGLGEQDPRVARLVRKLASKKWVLLYDSLKATFTLQAEGIAREVVLEATAAAVAVAASSAACTGASGNGSVEGGEAQRRAAGVAGLERLRMCLDAWEAYKDWCEEVDVYCELLNEQISAERYRTAGAGCGRGDNTPFIRDTALLSFRHSFALNVQIISFLRGAISKGMSALEVDRPVSNDAASPQNDSGGATGYASRNAYSRGGTADSEGGKASSLAEGVGDAEGLFTDLELMEDSRAIDFSVRSFARPGAAGASSRAGVCGSGARGASGGACGGSGGSGGGGGGGGGGSRAGGRVLTAARSSGSRTGHYYDWFLSKLEGKEAGIIRGDVDARGKSVARKPGGVDGGGGAGGGGKGEGGLGNAAGDVGGLRAATLEELLDLVGDMVEELDVPDDFLSKDRHTQGVMRRLLFLPIKRWQAAAAAAEANADDPQHLLMAGLSPAPGNEGFHRLRGGAAGRRKGNPPMFSVGKDAGKSWEQLSVLFG